MSNLIRVYRATEYVEESSLDRDGCKRRVS